jgi:RNA polymerase sigma-70 factor, ECF subfamily
MTTTNNKAHFWVIRGPARAAQIAPEPSPRDWDVAESSAPLAKKAQRANPPDHPSGNREFHATERDPLLVERCLRGDERAWEMIMGRYRKRIYNVCFRSTGRQDEAEDLAQDTLIRAYQTLRTFRSEAGSFRNWLFRVGRNLVVDHYRRERHLYKSFVRDDLEDLKLEDERTLSPQRIAEQAEAAEFLRDGMMRLSPDLKEAVRLRDMEGMTYHEIARLLGASEGTIKSRVSRGRTRLAKILIQRRVRIPATAGAENYVG